MFEWQKAGPGAWRSTIKKGAAPTNPHKQLLAQSVQCFSLAPHSDYTIFIISLYHLVVIIFENIIMGQHGSCIQGNPDWSGPYEKSTSKVQETELYDQIRKLATMSSKTKDLQEFEYFLKNTVNPTCPQHGSHSLHRTNSKTSSTSSKNTTSSKYEELFHKESSCKDINFNEHQVDNKIPSIKPIIAKNSSCKVHGHPETQEYQPKPSPPCRVHGHHASQPKAKTAKTESAFAHQERNHQPPAYQHPPQKQIVKLVPNFKPECGEFSDDDSTTASVFSFAQNS
ncbi:uncharacterized protein CEXT_536601 [Caerostris extrusa]|uniref:Uncharacterized protein n=1 Tax=Caerostris extrusa TaxID=172846 RepID=A0AAV4TUV1_CAEEX|nr:uncharacterized protein CEXT_536601 [Caerostris extrusa]